MNTVIFLAVTNVVVFTLFCLSFNKYLLEKEDHNDLKSKLANIKEKERLRSNREKTLEDALRVARTECESILEVINLVLNDKKKEKEDLGYPNRRKI